MRMTRDGVVGWHAFRVVGVEEESESSLSKFFLDKPGAEVVT